MQVKRIGGKVFGATFTAAEKKAMDLEIERQLAEYTKLHHREIDATVLWVLHSQLGWGEKRLRRFYEQFSIAIDELVKRYEMDTEDSAWLCTRKLADIGVNLDRWEAETSE